MHLRKFSKENKWKINGKKINENKRKEKGYASTHRKVALHILIISCSRGYETRTVSLLSTEAGQVLLDEVHDVSVVADNVGLSHANINVGALGEQFSRTCGILEDEE